MDHGSWVMTQSSAPSSFVSHRWTYDVFLSFRGKDTRTNFTGNLYNSLRQRGIKSFIDDEGLTRGEVITPALFKAIRQSRIAIIVFSKNYAFSTFCLDELVNILQCLKEEGRLVWPIFYDVDPCEVRHFKGSYGEAFAHYERRFQDNKKKVQEWRSALFEAANLSGWHLKKGIEYEFDFIGRITKEVSNKINRAPLHVTDYPVGLVSRVQKVTSLLNLWSNEEVNMVGICGIGGIGKSTIARAVYNSIADHFEGLCFLSNIRETSIKHGLLHLQETLLFELVGEKDIKLGDVYKGISIMKHRFHQKKILLILDDVDKLEQLQALAGRVDWFGPGSKIILTTRNRNLLASHGVERIYDVKELNDKEALQLFGWYAFKEDKVHPNYLVALNRAIHYSRGLPLALEVIGSNLYGTTKDEWSSALDKYERIPSRDISNVLKLSYDALEEDEKGIFLDLACFFKGYRLGDAIDMLSASSTKPEYAIKVLMDKSLIKINYDHVTMHGMIQDMGREIVRQESPKDPGKCSRLWFYKDIIEVLQENTGSNKCEAIFLDLPNDEEVRWSGEAFKEMKKLRMLVIRKAHFSKGPTYLPNSLRVLEWKCYPSQFLPLDFHPEKLVHLNLSNSRCVFIQPSMMACKFESVSRMIFNNCTFLRQVPNLSGVPNLTRLCLDDCPSLTEIHYSVGFLDKLRQLSAERCTQLTTFPHCIKLTSLEYLRLSWCSSLQSFPEILVEMKKMKELSLPGTAIEELPSSIGNAVGLEILNLAECEHLKQLPTSILMLPKLWILSTKLCREFSGFKESKGDEIEQVSLVASNIRFLSFSNCNLSDESLAMCLSCCPNLMFLDLSFNNFTTLPSCIKECLFLRDLLLDNCKQLQQIEGMPPNLETFKAKNCTLLTSLSSSILLNQAFQLPGNRNFIFPGNRIPEWFNHCNDGQSVSFWVRKEFPAIVVCFVVGVLGDKDCTLNFKLSVRINGTDQKFCSDQGLMSTLAIDHIFLCDLQSRLPMADLEKVLLPDEWNHVEVLCMNDSWIRLKGGVIKWSAVHVYNQENGMDMENIRFTKPNSPKRTFHDLWIKDLEPYDYYPLSKKQRTSLENIQQQQQQQQCLAFHNVNTNTISSKSCGTVSKHKEKDLKVSNEHFECSLGKEPWDYLNTYSTSKKSTCRTLNTISDQDREPVDHHENFQAPLPTLASTDNVTGEEVHTVDEVEMEAFYDSLDADLSVVSPFANIRLNEETRKALETLQNFMSNDFPDLLYPGHYSSIRSTLDYLSNLSADEGVSVKTRSLVLEVSREFTQWSRDFYEAGRKIELSKAKLLKADEIEEGLGVNMNQFRESMALEKEKVKALASLEEKKKKVEEQMNALEVEISNSRLSKDAIAKRKREIYEEGKELKVQRDESREKMPHFMKEWESAKRTQVNIKAEWSKLGEKFKSVK